MAVKFTRQTAFDHADSGCIGVLVANLGTPDSCRVADVRRYLRQFLMDRRVVEMPRPLWWLILNGIILNTRPRKTAHAYRTVWDEDGSPLLSISRRQRRKLAEHLGPQAAVVELGMRYGNPSIADALGKLRAAGVRRLLVLPLYPQYCAATTASTFDAVCAELRRWRWLPGLRFIDHYHDHPGYISALAGSVRDHRQIHGGSELLLMSFHGIPRAYFEAGDPYHCECRKTARLLAEELGLAESEWRVSFQSRLGPGAWLQPYTDRTLVKLAQAGTRDLQVICPGFSADCLETLEEMALTNRDLFMRAGGARYEYIPCLNDSEPHIRALASIVTGHLGGWDAPDTDRRRQKERAMALGAGA